MFKFKYWFKACNWIGKQNGLCITDLEKENGEMIPLEGPFLTMSWLFYLQDLQAEVVKSKKSYLVNSLFNAFFKTAGYYL